MADRGRSVLSSGALASYPCLPGKLLTSPSRLEFEHLFHRFDGSEEGVYASWQSHCRGTSPLSRQVQRSDAGCVWFGQANRPGALFGSRHHAFLLWISVGPGWPAVTTLASCLG